MKILFEIFDFFVRFLLFWDFCYFLKLFVYLIFLRFFEIFRIFDNCWNLWNFLSFCNFWKFLLHFWNICYFLKLLLFLEIFDILTFLGTFFVPIFETCLLAHVSRKKIFYKNVSKADNIFTPLAFEFTFLPFSHPKLSNFKNSRLMRII